MKTTDYINLPFIQVAENYRLFYKLDKEGPNPSTNFDFYGVWDSSGQNFTQPEPEEPEYKTFHVVVKGWAAFDGVRHIYFGNEEGYIYCPDVQQLAFILQALSRLEAKYCPEIVI